MTAQIGEKLILNGKHTIMSFCPPLPQDQRVVELKPEDIDGDSFAFSTGCWRQYLGTWEIKDDKFYLLDLTGKYKLAALSPLLADWFTGVIRIPQGKMLHYVHMGYGSVYESELHMKIVNGLVIKSVVIDNRNKDFSKEDQPFNNFPGFENFFDGDDL